MPRGGTRPNSGPKPAASHSETRKLIQQAADDGVLPLKIMFDRLRFYTKRCDELIAKILEGRIEPVAVAKDGSTPEKPEPNADIIEALREVLGIGKRMEEVAIAAAPYCHPRQGNANEGEHGDPEFVPLAERIAYYTRRDELKAAGGNIVDFAPK